MRHSRDHAIEPIGVGAQRDRRLLGQPVPQCVVVPQHEHQADGRGERVALSNADADVRARRSDEFEQGDAVVDDRRQCGGGVVRRGEAAQLLAGGGVHPHRFLRGVAERDERGPKSIGLVLRVADQVVGCRQGADDAEAGRLGQAQSTSQFRHPESVVRMSCQEVENGHDALGGR